MSYYPVSAGAGTTTVSGPIGGGGAAFQVTTTGVVIDGFTITRDGNNLVDWNNPGLNSAGVAIQGQTAAAEVKNCIITGNRTGIDINNSNGNNIHNNTIDNNRTGLIFRNQTDNTNLQENFGNE
ncbi:MAG: right-handed parallel beta-helix repeat-containing protein [Chitinophagaceae bacterium]|nr:right-handed parallel beta-helix repeat-containing protein [Chitinophagaceae bacterium]